MTKHNLNRLLPYKVHQQALIRRNPPFDLNPIILYSQVAWFQDFFPRQFGAQRLLFGYLPSFHNWRLSNIKTKGCLVFLKVLYQIFQATHIWAVIALTSILSAGAHATRGNSTQLQSFQHTRSHDDNDRMFYFERWHMIQSGLRLKLEIGWFLGDKGCWRHT